MVSPFFKYKVMERTELQNLYPRRYSNWCTMKSTESVEVSSGDLTVGNVYFIKEAGDASVFPGAITNKAGESFIATGTSVTWDGGILEDVTEGLPTEIGFFYGSGKGLQFQWRLGYNSNGDCVFVNVYDANLKQINY